MLSKKLPRVLAASFLACLGAMTSCGGGADSTLDGAGHGDPPDGHGADGGDGANRDSATELPARDGGEPDHVDPPGVAYDGVCTPLPVSTGLYDPDCVYLMADPERGDCSMFKLFLPSKPAERVYDFGCGPNSPIVRPTDGRLFFFSTDEVQGARVYRYHPRTTPTWLVADQLRNQEMIETCPDPLHLFMFPDDGKLLYDCADFTHQGLDGPFVEGGEPFDMAGYYPLAAGESRTVLGVKNDPGLHYAIVANGLATPVDADGDNIFAQRSRRGGGFWAVDSRPGVVAELREVLPDGEVRSVGAYQTQPGEGGAGLGCVLDTARALYCYTWAGSLDGIVRYTLDAPPELVFPEQFGNLAFTSLVTGP